MTTREERFMTAAHERLAAAQTVLTSGYAGAAVSSADIGMLYAARAALRKEGRYAKTHATTWSLFRRTFVTTGKFDADLFEKAERTLPLRLAAESGAQRIEQEQAHVVVEVADRFVSEIKLLVTA